MNFRRHHKKNRMKRSWWRAEAAAHRDGTKPQAGPVRRFLDSFVSDDPWYDWADQYLDGDIDIGYDEWMEKRNG